MISNQIIFYNYKIKLKFKKIFKLLIIFRNNFNNEIKKFKFKNNKKINNLCNKKS